MPDRSGKDYERQKQRSRDWKKQNPERHAELARAYRRRNAEKLKAQNLLNYAVRMGRIQRQPCEECGTTERVHGHHEDYSKPYVVHWLCFRCHKKAHPVTAENKRIKFEEAERADAKGEANGYSKLSNEDVFEIRKLLDAGISQERIGRLYGVHQGTISRIKLDKCWSHIK